MGGPPVTYYTGGAGSVGVPVIGVSQISYAPPSFGAGTGSPYFGNFYTPFRQGFPLRPGFGRRLLVHETRDNGIAELWNEPGVYFCQCGGPDWTTPIGAQRCQSPDPCALLDDPCESKIDRANKCISGRGGSDASISSVTLADHTCECGGAGFFATDDHRRCRRCPNPCEVLGDPCHTKSDLDNKCTWTAGGVVVSGRRLQQTSQQAAFGEAVSSLNKEELAACGGYTCTCDKNDEWYAPFGAQTCIKCNNPCNDDPCFAKLDELNSCKHVVPDLNAVSPTPASSPTQIPVASGLLQFGPSGVYLNPDVISQLRAEVCGRAECVCGGAGFVVPRAAETCERCLHPCDLNPCESSADSANRCVRITAPAGRRLSQANLFSAYNNGFNNLGLEKQVRSF